MPKIRYQVPIASISGDLFPQSDYYVRTYKEQNIIQRKPTKTSARQRAMREAFGRKYAGRHDSS